MNMTPPVEEKEAKKPGSAWVRVFPGVWKNTRYKEPWLYERPVIGGKPTFRSLHTQSEKQAMKELVRRHAAREAGVEPAAKLTAGDVIRGYMASGYPDRWLGPRPKSMRDAEERNCRTLLEYWDLVKAKDCTSSKFDGYRDFRINGRTCATAGTRMVDLELNTLANAFKLAKRRDFVFVNPMLDYPTYHNPAKVKHCIQFMAADADELHNLTRPLFMRPRSTVLGFQYHYECMTGLRTEETLKLGTEDPNTGIQFGSLTEDGNYMRVWRCKKQHLVNPYVRVHEGLAALMEVHQAWLADRYPGCKLFFPSPEDPTKVVAIKSLAHALAKLEGKRLKSHGARAWYVTVRRSWGINDTVIAFEIGHTSGGSTLAKSYGGVPASWLADGPKMAWLPKGEAAWSRVAAPLKSLAS